MGGGACTVTHVDPRVAIRVDDEEVLGWGGGGGDQLDTLVVQRVHQRDEAAHLVDVVEREARDVRDKDRVEGAGDAEVVRRA